MVAKRTPESVPPPVSSTTVPPAPAAVACPTCVRLRNLVETGEFPCPRCGGPRGAVAERLMAAYAVTR